MSTLSIRLLPGAGAIRIRGYGVGPRVFHSAAVVRLLLLQAGPREHVREPAGAGGRHDAGTAA